YYPYGMVITPQTTGTNDYRYGYQGQYAEKDPETDWNAFELRMYDSKIARWLSVDPKGQFHSPYVSMGNDPVGLTDPDGGKTNTDFVNTQTGAVKHVKDGIDQVVFLNNDDFIRVNFIANLPKWDKAITKEYFSLIDNNPKLDWNSDLGVFSRVMFAEIRNGKSPEIESVANIIKNRTDSDKFPDTYTGVITQKYQFSSLLPGDNNRSVYDNPYSGIKTNTDRQAWLNVLSITYKVHAGLSSDITNNSLLYYSPRSMVPAGKKPNWNFSQLQEVNVEGVRPNYLRMYKYK
ncbi:RHS repeat-associated core domain-containing protein, partial [Agriterribacter sp.]|uniref:RHS repeat-associated core domain-containing protein n=1 Tax=Agriterribacter sp. TaxID=2821509 RepID=UPI002D00FE07